MAETVYLLDGSALVYRSHFALARNPLVTTNGMNVSAVFGFAQTLLALINGEGARYLGVAFDRGEPTFRHEAFEAYKANRPSMPDDLVRQWPLVIELVEAAGLRMIDAEGMEADDVIASLATVFAAAGQNVVIVSGDKDFHPILSPRIAQWVPPRGKEPAVRLGPEEVRAKWGIDCARLLDVFALIGDAVDNVPGVKGIGEKTAVALIGEFGGLDALYARLDEVPKAAVREKLAAGREDAFRSRELIRLRTDIYPQVALESFVVPSLRERPGLLEILSRLEFRKMIVSLGLTERAERAGSYAAIAAIEDLRGRLAARESAAGPLALTFLFEPGSNPRTADPRGLALCPRPEEAYFVPLRAPGADGPGIGQEEAAELLRSRLEDPAGPLIAYEAKALLHLAARWGIEVRAGLFDISIASYLLDPDRPADLDTLTREMLGFTKALSPGAGKTAGSARLFTGADSDEWMHFACEEADACMRLWPKLASALGDRGQDELVRALETPLVPVLVAMERAGVHVDTALLRALGSELAAETARLAEEIHRLADFEFNINSPPQLGAVLFERLKLPKGKKTKTGYSTDSEVLEELAVDHPIARAILDYRQLTKLRSTYIDALPPLVDPRTSRIHARFHQTVAATGRLSSSDPNLQNIPIRTAQGRRIRSAFTAQDEGSILLSADYSQIELRLLAHLSGDPSLIEAFREGVDIHRATAARVFDMPPEKVDSVARARAKTVNFGVLYGMGPVRLSRELGISMAEARGFIEQYFAKMPSVRAFLEANLDRARKDGFVTTILGRRRYIPALQLRDPRARSQAERIASNTPIQGSAADLIKKAMISIHGALSSGAFRTRLVLQVHDELLFEGPLEEADEVTGIVRTGMESAIALVVPLVVDVGRGRGWDEAHG